MCQFFRAEHLTTPRIFFGGPLLFSDVFNLQQRFLAFCLRLRSEKPKKKRNRSRRDAWAFISLPAVTTFPRIFAFSTSSVTFFSHRGDCSSSVRDALSFPVFCEPFAGLSRSKFSITLCQIRILRTTWRSLYSNVTFLEKADEEAKSEHGTS